MQKTATLLTTIICLVALLASNNLKAQSLLWQISGNEIEKPSYLYGTIHLTCPDDLFVSDALKEAFDKTKQLVLELDMDAPDFMQKSQMLSVNPEMKNFSENLTEEDKKVINDFLQEHFKANLTQLGILKPFIIQTMIISKAIDCPQPASYEMTFMQITKEQKEEVFGLEEVTDQFAIFDTISQKKQIEWLVEYIIKGEKVKEEMKELMEAYKTEDLVKIQNITTENPEYKEYLDILLTNRNKNWISKIENYAKTTPTLFAVGAAHLPGENGVIELLRKQGYTLTPIKQ